MSVNDTITTVVAIIFVALWIPAALRQWSRRDEARSYDSEERIGAAADCEVYVASSGSRRFVELVINHSDSDSDIELHAYLTPSQARLLSEWVRLAATPGRTLADARRRSRKAPT